VAASDTLPARQLFVGEAFSLDSAVAARAAMAKSAHRGWKAAPTKKAASFEESPVSIFADSSASRFRTEIFSR
jgi:hypothetical protein